MTLHRAEALLLWYRRHRRQLPWRRQRDPWAILVSEVMAQQTQAERIVEHHRRFLERFPTPEALAQAPTRDVLARWSGLGYNRRALRLQAAARRLAADGWPRNVAGLQALPGVGPYTAAAVACFAFGVQVPAVDTNLRRVLSRWRGRPLAGTELEEVARAELPPRRARAWNQAMMDLGAGLCRPRDPTCEVCPVATWCQDPTVYIPPSRQARFEGSARQARGAILRALLEGPARTRSLAGLVRITGYEEQRLASAAAALVAEGLVVRERGRYRLP
jgi:A/G-specific adenine glycosylase